MKLKCDRCKKEFEGFRWDGGMTAGYYNTKDDGPWSEFAKPGENIVCDACMQSDSRYQKIYGPFAKLDEVSENLAIVKGVKGCEYCTPCVHYPCPDLDSDAEVFECDYKEMK